VAPPARAEIHELARLAKETPGTRNLAILADTSNAAFTDRWVKGFSEEWRALGGTAPAVVPFASNQNPSFAELAAQASRGRDAILFVSGAVDTGRLAQEIRKVQGPRTFFSTGWANAQDLIQTGGDAVEGLQFVQARVLDSSEPAYLAFRKAFQGAYGSEPDMASVYSWEAAQFLLLALAPDQKTLVPPAGRLGSGVAFPGLQGPVQLIPGGGVGDTRFQVLTVKDGRFQKR
jgi:branched-chain amino acid transport system substrate-binding protein